MPGYRTDDTQGTRGTALGFHDAISCAFRPLLSQDRYRHSLRLMVSNTRGFRVFRIPGSWIPRRTVLDMLL